jgi:hypothetical protein
LKNFLPRRPENIRYKCYKVCFTEGLAMATYTLFEMSSVIFQKFPLHNFDYIGAPQPTLAMTSIQPCFEFTPFD